jgi:8-oxo-dGTP pyrophosphatase MutT (NUDIX family)
MSSPDRSRDAEQALPPADTPPAGEPGRRKRRRRPRRSRKARATPSDATTTDQPANDQPVNGEAGGDGADRDGSTGGSGGRKRRRRRGRRSRQGEPATTNQAANQQRANQQVAGQQVAEHGTAGPGGGGTAVAGKKRRRRRPQPEEEPPLIRGRRRTRSGRIEEVSAGGLVVDASGDVVRGVLIGKHDRRGRLVWSLPKGHVEQGETLEQTAVRETEEETGVTAEVRQKLGEVDYWFMLHGEKIHKTVHHFLLRFVSGELCDRDVEVAEVAWVPLAEIPAKLAYPDERRLVAQVPELLTRAT